METKKRPRRMPPWLIWAIVLAGAAFAIKTRLMGPARLEIVTVTARDLTAQVYGNGTIEAKVMVGVSSTITGRVVELLADQGDQVTAGQLLARLEDDDFFQQERQAEAVLRKVAAAIAAEEATLGKARATLSLAEKNAQRFASLADNNLIARLEAEQYQTACTVAREEVARAQAALTASRMEEEASRASLELTRSRHADSKIYAPQDGVIISRDLELGATASPGLAIFTLADPRLVWLKANVDEAMLGGVAVDKEAVITMRSSPDTPRPAHVARLGRQSDRVTEELEVDVAFDSPLASFRLGEQADVLITTGTKAGAPSLPGAALIAKDGTRGVWRVSQGQVHFVKVQTGIEDRSGFSEIVSGLAPGDQVAMAPPPQMAALKEGMKVRGK